ncbi:hypothetical protein LEP48_02135 [Isoptericola sp. NEAU-Y5]|uniref:Uncharacterized protein n=1 Tax=Isoptericola luteus TaxID=2879484 RepID=A0ABS7ZCG8_9MICO|nr:hypothetical protein [Isoptericola sp. NEAU-Y5]MCA5892147.1 hypothetical protein [Isoptericola sp. NEAU-Y5]
MNTHDHARDDWADARTDETLRRELDALAGLGAMSSGLGDRLDGPLRSVRTRIRRRRAVKQAGLGVTTLAVAGALAVGGATLLPHAPQPLPGPAGTPTPSETTDATDATDPTDPTGADADGRAQGPAAVGLVENDYQPAWLDDTDLVCGMPADTLPANTLELLDDPALGTESSTDGTESVGRWTAPTRLTLEDDGVGDLITAPTLLWVQDGRVVDVGINTAEDGMEPLSTVARERDAVDSTRTACAPEHTDGGGDTYPTDLPPGEYEVRAYAVVRSEDMTRAALVLTEPTEVVVPGPGGDDGRGDGDDAGACSADGLDVETPDWSALPAPVRETAGELLDSALACDDAALTALATVDGTHTNFAGRSAEEFWGLPAAEQHEDVYAILAGLLTGSRWVADPPDDSGPFTYVWPRVATEMWADDAAAWQEAVDAGAVDEAFVDQMRGADGYLGWRLGIHEDGTWRFFVAGD